MENQKTPEKALGRIKKSGFFEKAKSFFQKNPNKYSAEEFLEVVIKKHKSEGQKEFVEDLEGNLSAVIDQMKPIGFLSKEEKQQQDHKNISNFFESTGEQMYEEQILKKGKSAENLTIDLFLNYVKSNNEELFKLFEKHQSEVLKHFTKLKYELIPFRNSDLIF